MLKAYHMWQMHRARDDRWEGGAMAPPTFWDELYITG